MVCSWLKETSHYEEGWQYYDYSVNDFIFETLIDSELDLTVSIENTSLAIQAADSDYYFDEVFVDTGFIDVSYFEAETENGNYSEESFKHTYLPGDLLQ